MPAWSSYVYSFNSPVVYVDPDGMKGIPAYLLKGTLAHSTFTAHMRTLHFGNIAWRFNLNILGLHGSVQQRPDVLYDNRLIGGVWELKPAPPAPSAANASTEAKAYARKANIENETERFQVGNQGGAPLPFTGSIIVTEKSTNTTFMFTMPDSGSSGAIYWKDITGQFDRQNVPSPSNIPSFEVNIDWQRVVDNTAFTVGLISAGYIGVKTLEKVLNAVSKPILPFFVMPINTNIENTNTNVEL